MNRTVSLLSLAAGLGLLALVLAGPTQPVSLPVAPAVQQPPVVQTPVPTPVPPSPVISPVVPAGSITVKGRLSHPLVGLGRTDAFVTVDLEGVEVAGQERAKVNLALVIDRSCSMAGEPLAQAKRAALHLVRQLGPEDRLSIVHYGSDVRAFGGAMATEENKARMESFIRRITDDGGTSISDGLSAGKRQVLRAADGFKVNRVILISDGQPTEGIIEERGLLSLAGRIRREGVSISSIGVGTEFNERVMQGIAEYGAGGYAYLRNASMLASIFQKELEQAGTTVARDVALTFELPEGVELEEVLGYRHTREGRKVRVPLTDLSAGQQERVIARVRVSASEAGRAVDVAKVKVTYRDLLAERPAEALQTLAALATEREEEIAERRDPEVAVHAARAKAAQNTTRAADLYAQGRRSEAKRVLQQNAQVFEEAAKVAGPSAVAADVAVQEELSHGFESARGEEEVQHQVKGAKARALKDFGRMGSTYRDE